MGSVTSAWTGLIGLAGARPGLVRGLLRAAYSLRKLGCGGFDARLVGLGWARRRSCWSEKKRRRKKERERKRKKKRREKREKERECRVRERKREKEKELGIFWVEISNIYIVSGFSYKHVNLPIYPLRDIRLSHSTLLIKILSSKFVLTRCRKGKDGASS